MTDTWAIYGSRNFFYKCLRIKIKDTSAWMGVCSFTSLRYFQWFRNLQRGIQRESPCQSNSNMWAQPWSCLFFKSHAFKKCQPPVCINAGFGTGDSPSSWPQCKAELSAPRARLMALMCLRLQVCQHTAHLCVSITVRKQGWLSSAWPRQQYQQALEYPFACTTCVKDEN